MPVPHDPFHLPLGQVFKQGRLKGQVQIVAQGLDTEFRPAYQLFEIEHMASFAGQVHVLGHALGAFLYGWAFKAIIVPEGFLMGGLSGIALLVFYGTGSLTPGAWFFLINLPVFALAWLKVSRRFFLDRKSVV